MLELDPWDIGLDAAVEATSAAIGDGTDVIYQAALRLDHQIGYPDFLVRAERLLSSLT